MEEEWNKNVIKENELLDWNYTVIIHLIEDLINDTGMIRKRVNLVLYIQ